jgi:type II secretory pathway component PulM
MEPVRKLVADVSEYLDAASPRERRLIGLVAAGVALFIALIVYASFSRAIGRAQTALDDRREDFAKVEKLAANFGAQEMERQNLEQRLRQSPQQLMSYVDNLAKQSQVEIGSMSDRGVVSGGQNGRPREMQVEFNLGKVPLDKLMSFLRSLESNTGVVRVRRLRIRKSYDNKEALDVSLAVSTWQL